MAARRRSDPIRVLVVGNAGVGKTTLIMAHINDSFPMENVDVYRVVELPPSDSIPRGMVVEDTPSSMANDEVMLRKALDRKDVVLLLYAVDDTSSFMSLQTYWLPILESTRVGSAERHIPVLLIGTKADLSEDSRPRQDREKFLELTQPLLSKFHCLAMAIECSAKTMIKSLHSVFTYAFKMVEYPVPPLYNVHERRVMPAFDKALKRIFRLCDEDRDNLLNESEITDFQEKCFGVRLGRDETRELFEVLRAEARKGVTDRGITEFAFKKLLLMFITQSRPDSTWRVLRYFHYNHDLELEIPADVLDANHDEDQIVELNESGIRFATDVFVQFAQDNVLPPSEVQHIFSIAPTSTHPFTSRFPFNTHCNKEGALTLGGWIGAWSMLLALDTRVGLENLYILGGLEPTKLTRLSSTRREERRTGGRTVRRSLRCFVVGDAGCGKSSLISGFLRRVAPDSLPPTTARQHSVAPFDEDTFMIFTEIPSAEAADAVRGAHPDCDVLCLCYQAGSRESFEFVKQLVELVPERIPVALVETQCDVQSVKVSNLRQEACAYCETIELAAPFQTRAITSAAECYKLSKLLKALTETPSVGYPLTLAVKESRARALRNKVLLGALIGVGVLAGCTGVWWLKRRR